MPFGHDCEFADFNACVDKMTGKVDDPEGYCAALMRETEEGCAEKRGGANMDTEVLKQLADIGPEDTGRATPEELVAAHKNMHVLFAGLSPSGMSTGMPLVVRTHSLLANELDARGIEHLEQGPLDTLQWLSQETARHVFELVERDDEEGEDIDLGLMKAATKEDLQYTFGVVYKATNEPDDPELDYHGEFVEADLLQKAQWAYVKSGDRSLYKQHGMTDLMPIGEWVDLVTWPMEEEVELTLPGGVSKKTTIPANSVWMGILWNDPGWKLVKTGRIRGLSIGGFAKREPVKLR